MKKIFAFVLISVLSISAFAKKVKFMVDMDTITVNVNGIHITGDFQVAAGFAADWDPATTAMTPEAGSPGVYSVVVNIPAFKHYEFKFVNGIFGYEVEFVPTESRVGYQFNDNRWIYIDSLANDTQIVKPVIYSQNAPAGKHLLRFRVDMRNVTTLDPKGVHVAGNFQSFDPSKIYMYSFDGDIFEYINYVDTGIPNFEHEFKYYNGNVSGKTESVPLACANVNGNRWVKIASDSILSAVCFAACAPCAGNGIAENGELNAVSVYPNPSNGEFGIQSSGFKIDGVKIYNTFGDMVLDRVMDAGSGTLHLSVPGIYFMRVERNGKIFSEKIIVE